MKSQTSPIWIRSKVTSARRSEKSCRLFRADYAYCYGLKNCVMKINGQIWEVMLQNVTGFCRGVNGISHSLGCYAA